MFSFQDIAIINDDSFHITTQQGQSWGFPAEHQLSLIAQYTTETLDLPAAWETGLVETSCQ